MVIEQTLFPYSTLSPSIGSCTRPIFFSTCDFFPVFFINSDCASDRNVNSAFSLGIQFQDESTSNGATPI